jgi:5-methyltetrahydropteroyltriglutamate--homocysteine methyltransferase
VQRSTDRILTTHTGSLPRPPDLVELLYAAEKGQQPVELEARAAAAVAECVRKQRQAGVDVVNDGEMGKVSYSTYPTARLTGFEAGMHMPRRPRQDALDFPEWDAETITKRGAARVQRLACTGPIRYVGKELLAQDIAHLKAAIKDSDATEAFLTAASPGVIAVFQPNQHYPSNEAYVMALADAMRAEYEAIWQAGFILQLDCPDFTGLSAVETPGVVPPDLPLRVAALNRAVAGIPAERMRMHLC